MTPPDPIKPGSLFDLSLRVHDLACHRSGRAVFQGLGLDLAPSQALLVTGPNGSGKSSLLRMVGGLINPANGTIRMNDPELIVAEQSHLIGHLEGIKLALTLGENVAYWIGLLGHVPPNAAAKRVQTALSAVDLHHLTDRPARFLSAGQKRRLGLARLIAAPRAIWLLDEPTLGLDQASIGRLEAMMAAHRAQGGIVIATSHQPIELPGAFSLRLSPKMSGVTP